MTELKMGAEKTKNEEFTEWRLSQRSVCTFHQVFDTISAEIKISDYQPVTEFYDTVCPETAYNNHGFSLTVLTDTMLVILLQQKCATALCTCTLQFIQILRCKSAIAEPTE